MAPVQWYNGRLSYVIWTCTVVLLVEDTELGEKHASNDTKTKRVDRTPSIVVDQQRHLLLRMHT